MTIVEYLILMATILSAAAFVLYLLALARAPVGHRPRTPTLDRYGRQIGWTQNPGYGETEDESETASRD